MTDDELLDDLFETVHYDETKDYLTVPGIDTSEDEPDDAEAISATATGNLCPNCGDVIHLHRLDDGTVHLACTCVNCPENCRSDAERDRAIAHLKPRAAAGSAKAQARIAALEAGKSGAKTKAKAEPVQAPTKTTPEKTTKQKLPPTMKRAAGPPVFVADTSILLQKAGNERALGGGWTDTRLLDILGTEHTVVYKPDKGYIHKNGISKGDTTAEFSPPKREAAAYELDQALGIGMTPPTVYDTTKNPPGSLQQFVLGENVLDVDRSKIAPEEVAKLAIFDLVVGNKDGHMNNAMLMPDGHMISIDHAYSLTKRPPWEEKAIKSFAINRLVDTQTFPLSKATRATLRTNLEKFDVDAFARRWKMNERETATFTKRIQLAVDILKYDDPKEATKALDEATKGRYKMERGGKLTW